MPPSGLRWEGERSEQGTHEAPRHACELPPRGPALHIARALGTRGGTGEQSAGCRKARAML